MGYFEKNQQEWAKLIAKVSGIGYNKQTIVTSEELWETKIKVVSYL